MNRFLTLLMMGALASFSLTGCDDDEKKPNGNDPDAEVPDGDVPDADVVPTTANVFVLHASPRAQSSLEGPVDLYVTAQDAEVADDAEPTAADLAYGQVAKLEDVPAGDYTVHVFGANADPAVDDSALTVDVTVVAGEDRTYAAVDVGEDDVEVVALDVIAPDADADNSVLLPIHRAIGVGTVDVYNVVDGEENDVLLVDDFAETDVGDTLALPAETYTLGVETDDDQVTNDTNDESYTVTFDATVPSGGLQIYTIVTLNGLVPTVVVYIQGTTMVSLLTPTNI